MSPLFPVLKPRFNTDQVLCLVALLVALGFGLFRVGDAAKDIVVTERSKTNYMIASWRHTSKDASLIAQVQGSKRVRYARGDDPFAKAVMRGVKLSEAEAERRGIVVFSGESCMIDRFAPEDDPLGAALGLAKAEAGRHQTSRIPIALMVGGLLGLWWRFSRLALIGAMALGVGLSLYQFATACPTCPATTLVGLPLSWWGAAFYGSLALALSMPRSAALTQRWIGPAAASIAAWQIGASTLTGTDCLPCAFVIALNSVLAVSALLGGFRPPLVAPPARFGRTLAAVAGCAVAALAVARVAGTDTLGLDGKNPQAPATLQGLSLSTLGLESKGRPEAVLLASEGCPPCLEALTYFVGRPDVNLRLAFVDSVPPSAGMRGELVPHPHLVGSTPTFVFTNAEGVIVAENRGWTKGMGEELETRVRALAGPTGLAGARLEEKKQ